MKTVSLSKQTFTLQNKNYSLLTKLSSTVITGEGDYPMDEEAILKAVKDQAGIYASVKVTFKKGTCLKVQIESSEELLETIGLQQLTVFNIQKLLCLDFGIRVFGVENTFLPDYA